MSQKPWEEEVVAAPTIEQMKRAQKTSTDATFILSGMRHVNVKIGTLRAHPLERKEPAVMVSGTAQRSVGIWFWKKTQALALDIVCFPARHSDKGTATITVLAERKA